MKSRDEGGGMKALWSTSLYLFKADLGFIKKELAAV